MKTKLFLLALLITTSLKAQFSSGIELSDTSWYLVGFKSNDKIVEINDTIYYRINSWHIRMKRLNNTHNDGTPTSIVWADNDGHLRRSPASSFQTSASGITGVLGISQGGTGISTLGSFGQMLRSNGTSLEYFTPSFLTSFTEVDPTVGAHIKAITTGNIATWNAALQGTGTTAQYFRGNGSLATFPTDNTAFTNGAGYLTVITSGQVTTALGFTPYNATNPNGYVSNLSSFSTTNLNEGSNLYFTNARARSAISLTTVGTSGVATYNPSTGVINVPNYTYTPVTPTINNNVARTLATSTTSVNSYSISTTQNARVVYSINVSWSITALLSTASSVFLEYTTNSGSTWITVSQVSKNINLGLVQSGTDDLNVSGEIPANALVRIRTTSTNSTITYTRGQEVLY